MNPPPSRYGFKPFSGSSHSLILEWVKTLPARLNICDVGSGEGLLSGPLRSLGHRVTAFDRERPPNPDVCDCFIQVDLSRVPPLPGDFKDRYDVILMADVLEHLPEPARVLRAFAGHLKTNGSLIVSVPNIAHLAIRLQLLLGRFEYADRGILDRGHVRFFTLDSFRALLCESSLIPESIQASTVPWPLVWPKGFRNGRLDVLNRLSLRLSNMWMRGLAYQFIAVCRPARTATVPGRAGMHGRVLGESGTV